MSVLNFIINEIFGQGAIFLALIAMIGLLLQKKNFSEVVRGTMMTAIGFFVLSQGTGIITGNSINGLAAAFNAIMPAANNSPDIDMSVYGTQIGIVMLIAFAFNLHRGGRGRGAYGRDADYPGGCFYGGIHGDFSQPAASSCKGSDRG